MGISAKELAKILGVSEASVSVALNGKPGVSTRTRARIVEAAKKYGYDFERLQAAHGTGKIIYYVRYIRHSVGDERNPFISQISQKIQAECLRYQYKLTMLYLYDDGTLLQQLEQIRYSGCDGMILFATEITENTLKYFETMDFPVLLLDNYFKSTSLDCIQINNVQGAYTATNYLISKTKKQPGYLHCSFPVNNFAERREGFYAAVKEHGFSAANTVEHLLSASIEGAMADMSALIAQRVPLASCYFADNDALAIGAMKAFQKAGFRIPKDISLIGFDNFSISAYVEPPLTTMDVSEDNLAELAVKRLSDLMNSGQKAHLRIELAPVLIERSSVYFMPNN